MKNVETIKSSLLMEQLLKHYGAEETSKNQYWCLLHEMGGRSSGHKKPSLVLHPNSQTITCMSQNCFEGDDIFRLIAKMEKLDIRKDFPKIIKIGSSIAGIQEESSSISFSGHSITLEHIEYLKNRGFNEETIKSLDLRSQYDHIIFLYKKDDTLIGYKAKTTISKKDHNEYKLKNPNWLEYYIKGKKPNLWHIEDDIESKKIIYLVAGEYDLGILFQEIKKKGLQNEIGVVTVTTGEGTGIKKETIEYLRSLNNEKFCIVYDSDDTGFNEAPKRAQELLKTGKEVCVFEWKGEMNPNAKEGFDINDYFIENKNVDIFLDSNNFKTVLQTTSDTEKRKKVKSKAIIKCFSEIKSVAISWLWYGRIALGKLTMIVGDPGLGKSLVTITIATNTSKGYSWPVDGSKPPIGDVIFISAEDDPADTIKPRLEAAGADCSRIHIIEAIVEENIENGKTERMFSLERDVKTLEDLLSKKPDCRLVIIDPISAYLGGADSNKNSDIRGLLAPLSKLAEKYKIAFVLISHLNKNSGENALYRTTGSLAFIAAVRTAYIVTKDKDNEERRLMMPLKNNIAKDTTGFAYSVGETENGAPIIVWEPGPVEMTAQEALMPPASEEELTATQEAMNFLRYVLAKGPVRTNVVQKMAREVDITIKPLRSAREKLGVRTEKSGTFKDGFWEWSLPEDALKSEEALPTKDGALGTKRHLGQVVNHLDTVVDYFREVPEKDKDSIDIINNDF